MFKLNLDEHSKQGTVVSTLAAEFEVMRINKEKGISGNGGGGLNLAEGSNSSSGGGSAFSSTLAASGMLTSALAAISVPSSSLTGLAGFAQSRSNAGAGSAMDGVTGSMPQQQSSSAASQLDSLPVMDIEELVATGA